MTQGILNPVKLPPDLNPAERKFAACLAEGTPCLIGGGGLPEKSIESGDSANVVRGEIVRFFAYGGDPDGRPVRGPVIGLQGAWVSGDLDLAHANIPYALFFGHCHFADSVVMQHAECAALNLIGSHLAKGLQADELMTKGGVYLCAGFSADGEVRLLGANIGVNLDCEDGKFHNPKEHALAADGLTTKGGVNLRAGFSADGEVRLLDANIGGNLDCVGGDFHNPKEHALAADRLTTKGDVHLHKGFSADGEVCLLGANIGGDLSCEGGKFHNPKGHALNVQNGNINGGLLWQQVSGDGVVYLGHAKAGVLADELDSWNSFKVVLDGFTYDQISGPTDAKSRIEWLAKRPNEWSFSPLPYEQAAKVLFEMGHANAAREILLEKEDLLTKRGDFPRWWKFGRRVWDFLAGYGYRPWKRTFALSLGVVLFGWLVFWCASEAGRIVPHQPVVLANPDYMAGMGRATGDMQCTDGPKPTEVVALLFPDYPEFNALVYSLDVFIPFFALHQEPYWYPKPREMDGWFLRWGMPIWYWLEIGAGWILTSLFLLSVTGVLRPRQSSGEKG